MKQVFICISDFRQGGIPRCLQTLLMHITRDKYKIDLLCLSKEGPYNGEMPNCTVLKNDYIINQLMVHSKKISKKNFLQYLPAIFLKILRFVILKFLGKDLLILRLKFVANKLNKYDCAIAYAEGYPALIVESIKSSNKLLWIHNDYAFEGARGGTQITNFACFNKICCVSQATQRSFIDLYPQYKDKTITIHNLTNTTYIINKAKEKISDKRFDTSKFTIISIGRICAQKRFYAIPQIAQDLKKQNIPFKWYILGGGQKEEVKLVYENIKRFHVTDEVLLLGEQDNPYKYLKHSDIFVLTSLYESYPTVINEARVLNIPIVSVNIEPIFEMLQADEATIVPFDEIAKAIANLYYDSHLFDDFKNISYRNHNTEILHNFYKIIDSIDD